MDKETHSDHDLVIRIDTKVDLLTKKVDDLVSGTTKRIESLEKEKADRTELQELQNKVNRDIECRVKEVEAWKVKRTENIKDESWKDRFIIGLLIIIAIAIIYHLTGYRI